MQLVAASCNLKLHYQGQWTCKSVGRKQQCRLTSWLSCAIFCVWNASKNRAPWKLSAKKVVKLTLSSITPMRLIVNKHHEGHAKIALKRKLNRAWNSWNASKRNCNEVWDCSGLHLLLSLVAALLAFNDTGCTLCFLQWLLRPIWCANISGQVGLCMLAYESSWIRHAYWYTQACGIGWSENQCVMMHALLSKCVSFDPSWNTDQGV